MTWLSRNAGVIEAIAASVTAVTAILAVAGVVLQLRAADDTSRAQSAREAYAAHLALAVANPDFAAPPDACLLLNSPKGAAYQAYVDHLLYAAEQMLAVEAGWEPTFEDALLPHAVALCAEGPSGATVEMAEVLAAFRAQTCAATPACSSEGT